MLNITVTRLSLIHDFVFVWQWVQHLRDGRERRLREHLGRVQQEETLPVPPLPHQYCQARIILLCLVFEVRVSDAKQDPDPDPACHFYVDPDPTIHFA